MSSNGTRTNCACFRRPATTKPPCWSGVLKAIAEAEIKNAEDTIPLVRLDSRLGWEPSMEYMCDENHLVWKIKQVRLVMAELDMYAASLKYNFLKEVVV